MSAIHDATNPLVRLAYLKAHLRLLSVGMKHSRISGKEILQCVTDITGTQYKRGQYKQALAEIESILKPEATA